MANVTSQWAKTTRPTGQASPYLSSALATGRGSRAELKCQLNIEEGNLGAGDDWFFFRLPADAIVEAAILKVDELDEGTDLTLQVRADSTNLLTSASTAGQTGGVASAGTNLPYTGNGNDPIEVYGRVVAAAATAKAGTATLTVHFTRP